MSADNVIPFRAGPYAGVGQAPAFNDERPPYHIALPGFPDITVEAYTFHKDGTSCVTYAGWPEDLAAAGVILPQWATPTRKHLRDLDGGKVSISRRWRVADQEQPRRYFVVRRDRPLAELARWPGALQALEAYRAYEAWDRARRPWAWDSPLEVSAPLKPALRLFVDNTRERSAGIATDESDPLWPELEGDIARGREMGWDLFSDFQYTTLARLIRHRFPRLEVRCMRPLRDETIFSFRWLAERAVAEGVVPKELIPPPPKRMFYGFEVPVKPCGRRIGAGRIEATVSVPDDLDVAHPFAFLKPSAICALGHNARSVEVAKPSPLRLVVDNTRGRP